MMQCHSQRSLSLPLPSMSIVIRLMKARGDQYCTQQFCPRSSRSSSEDFSRVVRMRSCIDIVGGTGKKNRLLFLHTFRVLNTPVPLPVLNKVCVRYIYGSLSFRME